MTAAASKEFDIFKTIGVVTSVADGIVSILGISDVAYGETIDIIVAGQKKIVCLVLNIESKKISAIVLDADIEIKPGDRKSVV